MIENSFLISSDKVASFINKKIFYKKIGQYYLYLRNNKKNISLFEVNNFIYILIGYVENIPLQSKSNYIFKKIHKYLVAKRINCLEGKFNIISINKKTKDIFIYSSTKQSMNIFYSINKSALYITNNIYNFKFVSNFILTKNQTYENFYLEYDFFPFQETHVDKVKTFPSDKYIKIDKEKNICFVSLKNEFISKKKNKNNFDELHNLFKIYFRNCLPLNKNKKIAVLMGGIDSMFVAKFISDLGYSVDCFTFFHKNKNLNQRNISNFIEETNIKHFWVPIDNKKIFYELKKYPKYGVPSSFAIYYITTGIAAEYLSKKNYNFFFTGDGCDEIFYGFPTVYKRIIFINKLKKFTSNFTRKFLMYFLSLNFVNTFFRSLVIVPRRLLFSSLQNDNISNFLSYKILEKFEIDSLLHYPQKNALSNLDILNLIHPNHTNMLDQGYAGRSASSSNKQRNQYIFLRHGTFAISPFYNKKIITFAKRLANDKKISKEHNLGKDYFLKYLKYKNILSDTLIYQSKQSPVVTNAEKSLFKYFNYLKINSNYLNIKKLKVKIKLDISVKIANKIYKNFYAHNFFYNIYTYFNFFR